MRTLRIIIILLFISNLAYAQKNFEGKIIYQSSDSIWKNDKTEILFGKQQLRINEQGVIDNTPITTISIIDFAKGIISYLNEKNETYYKELMWQKEIDSALIMKPCPEKNKVILGYTCSAYQLGSAVDSSSYNDLMAPFFFYFWYADSLFYRVDEKYCNAEGIVKATNGMNVGMGMELNTGYKNSLEKLLIEPTFIIQQEIPDAVFSLAGLELEKKYIESSTSPEDSAQIFVDSIARLVQRTVDSVVKAMEKQAATTKKPPSKKSSSKNTHKQPTTPPATKPKD